MTGLPEGHLQILSAPDLHPLVIGPDLVKVFPVLGFFISKKCCFLRREKIAIIVKTFLKALLFESHYIFLRNIKTNFYLLNP